MSRLGFVVIGRNEGQRLMGCLGSLPYRDDRVVYVDSGSTDGSAENSRSLGVSVVALDMGKPFTAARARNEGFAALLRDHPGLSYVQFVDGDCEVREGWIEAAEALLESSPSVVVACGRRRERDPAASVYNKLTDMEWDTPTGLADACGGDALMRVSALQQVGGYDPTLIAGEEPDLCHRMTQLGGQIMRLDVEMTMHDADLHHFSRWWTRSTRAGHAYAENYWNHRSDGQRFRRKELLSILVWGAGLPLAGLAGIGFSGGLSLLVLGAYGVLWGRIKGYRRSVGDQAEEAALYARYCVVGKIAQAIGALQFFWNRLARGKQSNLIEYK